MMVRLGDVAQIQAGYPFRGSVLPVSGGNARVLQIRDLIGDGRIAWDQLVQTDIEPAKNSVWLNEDDIVFVARGARTLAVCLEHPPAATVCSQYFFLLRTRTDLLIPEFLAWQINGAPAQRYLAGNAEGTDQLSIRRGVLENLPLAVPPLADQHRYVELARIAAQEKQHLQALIRNRQQQLDALAFTLVNEPTSSD